MKIKQKTSGANMFEKIAKQSLFAIAALLLAVTAASLFLQVIARELWWQVDWTEELARFAFISMVFMASTYATLTDSHLRVSVFSDLVAGWIGEAPVAVFHLVILIGFDGLMVWYSGLNFVDGLHYPNISPSLDFNQNHLFLFMAVGFALSGLIHLIRLVSLPLRRSVSATGSDEGRGA